MPSREIPLIPADVRASWLLALRRGKIERWEWVGRIEDLHPGAIILVKMWRRLPGSLSREAWRHYYLVADGGNGSPRTVVGFPFNRSSTNAVRKLLSVPSEEVSDMVLSAGSLARGVKPADAVVEAVRNYPGVGIREALSLYSLVGS